MLHHLSWLSFAKTIATVTALYYSAVIGLFFRKEAHSLLSRKKLSLLLTRRKNKTLLLAAALALSAAAHAQDPNAGINQANTLIRGMFDTGTQLMYAIGAILGLVGAVKTYKEWNAGHQQEAYRAATGWLGSCLFLVVVATVIKSFFGL